MAISLKGAKHSVYLTEFCSSPTKVIPDFSQKSKLQTDFYQSSQALPSANSFFEKKIFLSQWCQRRTSLKYFPRLLNFCMRLRTLRDQPALFFLIHFRFSLTLQHRMPILKESSSNLLQEYASCCPTFSYQKGDRTPSCIQISHNHCS